MNRILVLTMAGLLALTSAASAATQISSPPIFAATTQRRAECILGNIGAKPIVVKEVKIVGLFGGSLTTSGNCGGRLQPSFVCSVFASNIDDTNPFACTATVEGSDKDLRGSVMLLDESSRVIRSAELR